MTPRRCLSLLLTILALASNIGNAASLGEVHVNSFIGQPFSATIAVELSATDDVDRMVARIAPAKTHKAFGLIYDPYLQSIDIKLIQQQGKFQIRLTGRKLLREAYLGFIIELRLMSGSVFRAYNVLPDFYLQPAGGDVTKKTSDRVPVAGSSSPPRKIRVVPPGDYTVRSGDSVWLVAAGMDNRLGNIRERIQLLRLANPALNSGNIKPGDQLSIPADNGALSVAPRSPDVTRQAGSPVLADAEALAGVQKRARGFKVVRLAAVSGPEISQSPSGVATVTEDAGAASLTLELEEIRQNLEQLAAENATLTEDVRRLEAQSIEREKLEDERLVRSPVDRLPLAEQRQGIRLQNTGSDNGRSESVGASGNGFPTWLIVLAIISLSSVVLVWWIRFRRRNEDSITEAGNFTVAEAFDRDQTAPLKDEQHPTSTGRSAVTAPVTDNDPKNVESGVEQAAVVSDAQSADGLADRFASSLSADKPATPAGDLNTTPSELHKAAPAGKTASDSFDVDPIARETEPPELSNDLQKTTTPAPGGIEFDPTASNADVDPEVDNVFPTPATPAPDGIEFDPTASEVRADPAEDSIFPKSSTPAPDGIDFDPTRDISTQDQEPQPASTFQHDTIDFNDTGEIPPMGAEDPEEPIFGNRGSDYHSHDFIQPPEELTRDAPAEPTGDGPSAPDEVPENPALTTEDGSDPEDLVLDLDLDLDLELELDLDATEVAGAVDPALPDEEKTEFTLGEVFDSVELPNTVTLGDGRRSVAQPTEDSGSPDPVRRATDDPDANNIDQRSGAAEEVEDQTAIVVPTGSASRWVDLQQEWERLMLPEFSDQNYAVFYTELEGMESIEDQHGPIKTEGMVLTVLSLLQQQLADRTETLHRIKDHTFLMLTPYADDSTLRERGESLVRLVRDHTFVADGEPVRLSLGVGIVPVTGLFNSLDDYVHCAKVTVAKLDADPGNHRASDRVAIHSQGGTSADWEDEESFLAKVRELLHTNMFEVQYQTLINLGGSHEQVYLCKTELGPEVDQQSMPEGFLRKAFTCQATPEIERFSIQTFLDKILTLNAEKVKMLFRIDIRSAMDPEFEGWLFHQLEAKGVEPDSIVLFVYADDVIEHKPHIIRFSGALRREGIKLGMLNVDYDSGHLQAAIDVGASMIRVSPNIVDEVVVSSAKFGSRPVTSGTRESSNLREYLNSFHQRSIETVLFSTYVDAIPGLVVINASNLRATYIQTPIGMIEDDPYRG